MAKVANSLVYVWKAMSLISILESYFPRYANFKVLLQL